MTASRDSEPRREDGTEQEDVQTLMVAVRAIVGELVLFHSSTPISGAMLELGRRRLSERPYKPDPSNGNSLYEGDKQLFIQCAWRIHGPTEMLPKAKPSESWEKWDQEMDLFVGARIIDARLDEQTFALWLDFDNEMALDITPVQPPDLGRAPLTAGSLPEPAENPSSYWIRLDNDYYSAYENGEITIERNPAYQTPT